MGGLVEKFTARRKAAFKGLADANRALSELRAMGAKLQDQRAEIEARPVPLKEAQDAAALAVRREAEGDLDRINFASVMQPADGRAPRLDLTEAQRAALAFASQAEDITALLKARLAERYEVHGLLGIGADEKTAKLAQVDDDMLACELAEESMIRSMEAEGAAPLRRADADPRATLADDKELK